MAWLMRITEDRWLSEVFGYGAFKVDVDDALGGKVDACVVRDALRDFAVGQARAFCYARVETQAIEVVRGLGMAGMYVVDVNVTLTLNPRSTATPGGAWVQTAPWCCVEPMRPEQQQDVIDIAYTSFRYSRFHLDPLVPRETANIVKREWTRDCALGKRGKELLVASRAGRPVGFLAVNHSEVAGKPAAVIDLMCVREDCRRLGGGMALVGAFIERHKDQCDHLRVGTQAANVPSIRLYEKLGFSVSGTSYLLHMHV